MRDVSLRESQSQRSWVKFYSAIAVAVLLPASAQAYIDPFNYGALITYGNTSMGVVTFGNLDILGDTFTGASINGSPFFFPYANPSGTGLDGIGIWRSTGGPGGSPMGDAMSPGCPCEGWGVAGTIGSTVHTGYANRSAGYSYGNINLDSFAATPSSAISVVSFTDGNPLKVIHSFGPSLAPDTFQVNVSLQNTSFTNTASNVVYRRAMDWDVPPTEFNEFITHGGVAANFAPIGNVLYASDNGFAFNDPTSYPGFFDPATENMDFVHSGANDHGSVFDFGFGDLAPNESRNFNIFYGTAANEAEAYARLGMVNAQVFSIGLSSSGAGPATDSAAYFFGFSGVGGAEAGMGPDDPILPFVGVGPNGAVYFTFDNPTAGRWFDPPSALGFSYELTGGGAFTEVMTPGAGFGFGPVDLYIGGTLKATLAPGGSYFFDPGVSLFSLLGLSPMLDPSAPGFATAYPTFLDFTGSPTALIMTPILTPTPAPVPEPSTLALLGAGLAGLATLRRRRKARN